MFCSCCQAHYNGKFLQILKIGLEVKESNLVLNGKILVLSKLNCVNKAPRNLSGAVTSVLSEVCDTSQSLQVERCCD